MTLFLAAITPAVLLFSSISGKGLLRTLVNSTCQGAIMVDLHYAYATGAEHDPNGAPRLSATTDSIPPVVVVVVQMMGKMMRATAAPLLRRFCCCR